MAKTAQTKRANKPVSTKEPFVRLIKRDGIEAYKAWLIRLIAVIGSLVVNALFIYLVIGISPIEAYSTMFEGAFGSSDYTWKTISAAVRLLCVAVALAPAFKMRFWNIGGEGQVLVGALASAIVMTYLGRTLPSVPLILTMLVAGVLAGAIWGLIPAIFKAKFDTNETLFTLMMNYVAMKFVSYFYDLWKGAKSSLGKINMGTKAGWFPNTIFGHRYDINIIVIVVIAILMFFYLKSTKHGYEISVVGASQNTARYAGINVKKVIIRTMLLSGAICGLCGFLTVAGQDQTVSTGTASGYGFTAIIVAWLAKFNTFGMMLISVFIIFLENGTMQITNTYASFSSSASSILIGIVLFFIIGCEFFINYRLKFRTVDKKEIGKVVA